MTTPAAERMRALRQRRALGVRILRVPVQIDTVEVLVEKDYLAVEDVHDMDAVANALAAFIEDQTDAVTRNAICLDSW